MMVIDNKYNIGDIVYLKTDKEQLPRMIVAIQIRSIGICYCLIQGTTETYHHDIEFATEKDYCITTTN